MATEREIPVVKTPNLEGTVAAGGGYVAWGVAQKSSPHRFAVLARKGTGRPFRVNAHGTKAYAGGIDGRTLIYEQVRHGQANLKLFDLATKRRSDLPNVVNSAAWEFAPSISGHWILFSRSDKATGARSINLYNRATKKMRVLDSLNGLNHYMAAGQVNGRFAVWAKCRQVCNIFRYDLSSKKKFRIPNAPGKYQYNPSVTPNGTVYFWRSGRGCGTNASLRRFRAGSERLLLSLPSGVDSGDSFAVVKNGHVHLFYDRLKCSGAGDIYKIID